MAIAGGFRPSLLAPAPRVGGRPLRRFSVGARAGQNVLSGLFPNSGKRPSNRDANKAELLELIATVDRGSSATEKEQAMIDELCTKLEQANPTPKPLESPLLNGQWELLYSTSKSILGLNRPGLVRPRGPIYQILDAPNLKARNRETSPLYNEVSAELTPVSNSRVNVKFTRFKVLGTFGFPFPEMKTTPWLDTTYLDDDLRISRGYRGNLFVLAMDDRGVKP
eukprot:evm.model.scf_2018.1 EVM.evm.TU.scf_2018.1   scf_2018:5583-9956(+)